MTLIASTKVPDGIVIAADSVPTIIAGQKLTVKEGGEYAWLGFFMPVLSCKRCEQFQVRG